MQSKSFTFTTFKNILHNLLGYIWPTLLTIFVTPIIIYNLGIRNYGIYIFINTVISLLGLLDFGIGMSVTRNLAYYVGSKDDTAISRLVFTGNSMFVIISFVGLAISSILAYIAHTNLPLLSSSSIEYGHYSLLILIGGGIFFFNTIDTVYSGILYSLQRFDISNLIGITSITISSISTLIIVLNKGSLLEIFLAQLAVSILICLANFYYGKKVMPQARYKLSWDKKEVKDGLKFSLAISINNIANNALTYLDRLIIPFFVGPSYLSYYSVPGNVTTRIPSLANTLSTTVFPTTSHFEGSGERDRLESLYIRSFRLITMVSAAITVPAIAFSYKILLYWINIDFAEKSYKILIILAATNFILALSGPLSNFLIGLKKLRFTTTMSVIMSILNTLLLLILLPKYGILGAAWAYLISVLPVFYMFYYTERNFLNLTNRKKYYIKKITGILATSVIVLLIDTYIISPFVTNLTTVIIAGILSVLIYIILYKCFGLFEPEDWNDIKTYIMTILIIKRHKQDQNEK